ncbi:hypothetical protein SLS62_004715 [Diatrype stigma]|uniref:Uncharacterized protein n=1 Tax=Diatrype stigma TaxID=117547 RepID=A0AAN9YT84_9PEZI
MPSGKKPLTWLITGSSNGLGLALTRHVLSTGDNVIATSRNPAKTHELVQEVESQSNGKWISFDNTWSQDKIQQAIGGADAVFPGGIDVLVNNGASSLLGAVEDVPEEEAKAQFETNFWGPLRICNTILPYMRQRGRGTIVNVSSLLGLTTWPAMGFYLASKFALESISQVLAAEVAPFGIRVLIVEPGAFRTKFLDAMQIAAPSPPYRSPHAVEDGLRFQKEVNGKQPGDPDKAALVIYDAISGKDEQLKNVLRLPLGSDYWYNGLKHLDGVRRDFESSKHVALGTEIQE